MCLFCKMHQIVGSLGCASSLAFRSAGVSKKFPLVTLSKALGHHPFAFPWNFWTKTKRKKAEWEPLIRTIDTAHKFIIFAIHLQRFQFLTKLLSASGSSHMLLSLSTAPFVPGAPRFTGSPRVGRDWATELNGAESSFSTAPPCSPAGWPLPEPPLRLIFWGVSPDLPPTSPHPQDSGSGPSWDPPGHASVLEWDAPKWNCLKALWEWDSDSPRESTAHTPSRLLLRCLFSC